MEPSRFNTIGVIGLVVLGMLAAAEAAVKQHSLAIRGRVIDDETGKPIVKFVQQSGYSSAKDPEKVVWGGGLSTTDSPRKDGSFSDNLGWEDGLKAWSRIMADDYLPQPIRDAPFSTEDGRIDGLVVRMKRGRKVEGRVVDSSGKAVAGGRVFLYGGHPLTITDGRAIGPFGPNEMRGVSRGLTDAEGRFTLTGAGGDMDQVAVSAPAYNLWSAPIPPIGQDFLIRLPEPGRIALRYEIDGDEPEAEFAIQLSPSPFKLLATLQHLKLANKGRIDLEGLTPAAYDVARLRRLSLGDRMGALMFVDRRTIVVKAGESTMADFVHDRGTSLAIEVDGLEALGVTGATIRIRQGDERSFKKPRYSFQDLVDAFNCDVKGRIKTPRYLPGVYTIVAEAYRPASKDQGFRGGMQAPDYRSIAVVTVAEGGAEPTVRIEMPKPDPALQK